MTGLFHKNAEDNIGARLRTSVLKTAALSCVFLAAMPSLCFAQLSNDRVTTYSQNPAIIHFENAAESSLQDGGLYTAIAAYSPVEPMAEVSAEYWAPFADQTQASPQGQTTPPVGKTAVPSLPDLFPTSQTASDPHLQAELNKRTHMLKTHQTLGLITAIPMVAALITGPQVPVRADMTRRRSE